MGLPDPGWLRETLAHPFGEHDRRQVRVGGRDVGHDRRIDDRQALHSVDAAVGGSAAVSKVTVAGLKKLSESGKLDPEPQRWVDATISLLESDDPKNPPSDVKKLIIDGCAKNGYTLQNLK